MSKKTLREGSEAVINSNVIVMTMTGVGNHYQLIIGNRCSAWA
jgi:hypothetical protein